MAVIVANPHSFPHGAIILTGRSLLDDFDMRKVALAYERRKEEGVLGTDAAIWELEIHPTNFCNLKCSGCSYAGRHDQTTVDIAALKGLLDHYRQFDLRSVFVSGGGDPSYWSGWHRVFGEVVCSSFKIGVSTNLSNFRQISRVFNKVSFFQIHVVGYDAASTLRETGVDCFDAIQSSLDELFTHLTDGQQVTMKVLVKNENVDTLPSFMDFIARYPCDAVVLKLKQNFRHNVPEFDEVNSERVRNHVLSHSITERFDFMLDNLPDSLYRAGHSASLSECQLATSGLYRLVTAEGLIYPCVAATYNRANACGHLSDMVRKGSEKPHRIDLASCPLQACRHYRCSLEIDTLLHSNGQQSSTDPWMPSREPTLL